EPSCGRCVGASRTHEHADLVGRRVHVLGEKLAVACLQAGGAGNLDVLADFCDQLEPPGLERRLAEREELLVLRDRFGLAPDGHDRADVAGDRRKNLTLGRGAARLLAGGGHALLAQQALCRLDVSPGLLERTLGGHHPRAGSVAELLDEAGWDLYLAHVLSSVLGVSETGTATASGSGTGSASTARAGEASSSGSGVAS